MDTQALQTFIVLANLRSFTKTADELFLAQSTVTNRIAELENEVGKRLFARNKRNVELTQEGMEFYQYAKRIVALTEEGIRAACALKRYDRKWNSSYRGIDSRTVNGLIWFCYNNSTTRR